MTLTNMKEQITVDDFWKVDIRVGTVIEASNIEGSTKLLKLQVDFGELGKRQILTGMAMWYRPEELVGLKTLFVVNIPIRKMMGLESNGMIMGTGLTDDVKPIFIIPKDDVANGEGVR